MQKVQAGGRRARIGLVFSFLRGAKRYYFLDLLAAGTVALSEAIQPQIVRVAVDHIIGREISGVFARLIYHFSAFPALLVMTLAVLAVALLQVLAKYFFKVFEARASETLVKNMRDRLFSHILRLPFSVHTENKTGDLIQRCTSDIETTKQFVSEQLTSLLRIVLMLVLSMVFMFRMNAKLTWIALIPIPFIVLFSFVFHNKLAECFEECDENEGKLSAVAQENLTGARVIRAFGQERAEIDKFEKQNRYYTGLWEKAAGLMSRFWSFTDVISGIQIMLLVVCGAAFCIGGSMTEGEYIAFISYNTMLVWPIRSLGRMISELSKAGVSVERIAEVMFTPVEQDEEGAVQVSANGDISFHHVAFGYKDGAPILRDIDFTMRAGSTLGILGRAGSGKSTLVMLLDKLYPVTSGSITVGGKDIREIKTAHLRRQVGMVLQEPYLFSGTIGENIGIAREGITQEEIRAAASAAALDETVQSFAKGYDTMVGERGVTLSGGQKQRTAIARLLTLDTPILIFDDSLSAVDTETDAKIRRALRERFRGASVILISHRITTLSEADQIIVLDRGRIVERGTHEELIHAGGSYQKIYETQSCGEEVTGV